MHKRIIAAVLLGTFVFVACVLNVAPNSGQSGEIEVKNEEIVTENKRGISSVIENSLDSNDISGITKHVEDTVKESPVEEIKVQKEGWTTENLNIRENPSTDANVLDILPFNVYIKYYEYDDEWAEIAYDNGQAYINRDYIGDEECDFVMYNVPKTNGFKSYMPYTTITNKSSKQYKLQQIASTGEYGIRKVNGRWCVAVGTAFNADIGTYIDLILEDGFVISCVVSDIKQDIHTESNNMVTRANNCVSEFLVDPKALHKSIKKTGDVSSCNEFWKENVRAVVVYDKSVW